MKDEEFYMYCAYKALSAVTLALQIVFTSMWEEKFPGTVFSIEELKKISDKKSSKKKSPKRNTCMPDNADVKEWDISKLAYVMVEADALDLQATDQVFTVAINDTKNLRNEIVHKSLFACDKREFEIYFRSFQKLVQVLESNNFKKYSDNKECQLHLRKVDKFYHADKPVFGDKLRKMKSEYETMKMENMRYSIKEDCAKEKSVIECKLSELQKELHLRKVDKFYHADKPVFGDKLRKMKSEYETMKMENMRYSIKEDCAKEKSVIECKLSELQKELHKLKIEKQHLVQTLSSETMEKESLREKQLLNKKKRKQLQLKLRQKEMEIRREKIKRKNICKKLKKEEEKKHFFQTKLNSITEENRALHVQTYFNTEEKNALQMENRMLKNINLLLILGIALVLFMECRRVNNEFAAETDRTSKDFLLVMLYRNNTLQGNVVMELTWEKTELKRQNKKLTLEKQKYLSENRHLTEEVEEMRGEIMDLKMTARAVKVLEEAKGKLFKVTEDQAVIIQDNILTIEQQNEKIRECDTENTYLGTQFEEQEKTILEQKHILEEHVKTIYSLEREILSNRNTIENLNDALSKVNDLKNKLHQKSREIQGANDMSVGSNGHIQYDNTDNTLKVAKINNITVDIIDCYGTNINIKGGITEKIVARG